MLIVAQLVNKLSAFYGTRTSIILCTTTHYWTLSSARSTQSTPSHPIYLWYALTLSAHLYLRLPSCLFPSGITTKVLCVFPFPPASATCSAHLIRLDFITLIKFGEEYNRNRNSEMILKWIIMKNVFGNVKWTELSHDRVWAVEGGGGGVLVLRCWNWGCFANFILH